MADTKAWIVETGSFEQDPKYAVVGLPDVGLVGSISTGYLVSNLKAKEVGFVDSEMLPPIMLLHDSVPKETNRLFSKDEYTALLAETPLPPALMSDVIRASMAWFKAKGISEVFSLGGVAAENRAEMEKPEVFVISNDEAKRKLASEQKMNLLQEGVITGPFAQLMRQAIRMGIVNTVILAQAFQEIPDPEASVAVLDTLGKLGGPKVNVDSLNKMASEIKMRSKELLQKAAQPEEDKGYNVPMMYG
ncbi:MAG: PAC2 family protein [Candidatus Marsarchaeota archaeon]|nr:PAC2 family protein [Candidatus Marsarchaeota archaeon]